jgi:response regulator RpfG family c-di-GMP phosphodiesterase
MKVLFVDDEKEILSSIRRQFRKESFEAITCNSANEALELLNKDEFQVIVSDERMPVMSGLELMKKVKQNYPEIIRIILSGYADSETIINAINMGEIFRFVSKPWVYDDIKRIIGEALDKWSIEKKNKKYMEHILDENRRLKMRLTFRESSLSLEQDVIDEIPVPLVGIGNDGSIEIFNKNAKDEFLDNIQSGNPITSLIPNSIYIHLESNIKNNIESGNFCLEIFEIKYTIFIRALRPTDPYKGIILFERV